MRIRDGQMDRQTDRQSDSNIPPSKFNVCEGMIKKLSLTHTFVKISLQ